MQKCMFTLLQYKQIYRKLAQLVMTDEVIKKVDERWDSYWK